ncbi:MAG TPA: SMC family ATPase [Flexilinea sp.]|jgi:exonuclease SbcC|nr:SMC family ATPase [Flexilinea sp.]HOR56555.1 SMC family ATPase [Flexilinea sp.]HPJ64257.1 SMC family ATPase [Flexilinea sp.]HPR70249.1 SMC family ATPase [Flexilinea sp.]
MIPRLLKISGFLSYKEPVEIDFTRIHVACISGSNGAGKSALLDAMTWALFGQARKNDETIINNSRNIDAAEVTFEFEYESNIYRIIRCLRRGKTSTVDLLIWNQETGNWHPMTEKSVRQTNKRIEELLHLDFETFINASFFLQGKADQFTSQSAGDRKKILSNILELDIWEKYQTAAAEKRRNQTVRLSFLENRLDEIEKELSEEPRRREVLNSLDEELKKSEEQLVIKQQAWQNAKSAETLLESHQAAYQSLLQNYEKSARQIDAQKSRLSKRTLESLSIQELLKEEPEIESGYRQLQKIREELSEWNKKALENYRIDGERKEITGKIGQLRAGLESEQATLRQEILRLEKNFELIPELSQKQKELQTQLESIEAFLSEKESVNESLRNITEIIVEKRAENQQLDAQMRDLKKRITELQAAQVGTPCPFCGRELDEEHTLTYLQSMQLDGKKLGDRYRINSEELKKLNEEKDALNRKLSEIQNAEKKHLELSRLLAPISAEIKKIQENEPYRQKLSDRLNEIQKLLETESFCAEERQRLSVLDEQAKALGYNPAAHEQCREKESELALNENRWQKVQQAKAALQPIQREIIDLTNQIAADEKELKQIEGSVEQQKAALDEFSANLPDLQKAKKEFDTVQAETNRIRLEKGAAEQLVSVLESLKKQKQEVIREREEANLQISQLKYLEKAFSKNGIPAILIDQALPEIEEHANLILGKLTDERMSVRFSTQKEYKDKNREDKIETLAIFISDETGSREYELFSGGEAFRINFAIRLALSHILTKRAGARLQMLVIDEGFGSQDEEGRQRLIEAIIAVQDDYKKILVITHLDELKDAFPSRIEVEKTPDGSRVNVIE